MTTPVIVLLIVFAIVVGVLYWSIRRLENVVGYIAKRMEDQVDVFRGVAIVIGGDEEHKDVIDMKEQFKETAKEILDGTIK